MNFKALSLSIVLFFTSIIFASCTPNDPNSDIFSGTKSVIGDVSSKEADSQDTVSKTYKTDKKRVYFIGNGYSHSKDISKSFFSYCQKQKQPYYVTSKDGSISLQMHMCDLKSGEYKDTIKTADIVVFKELDKLKIGTAEAIEEIIPLFEEDTIFYFCLTVYDYIERPAELKNIKNITYIPAGYIIKEKLDQFFTDNKNIENSDDVDILCDYITNLTVYSVITGESCVGFTYDNSNRALLDILPGETDEEKLSAIKTIQQKVMEGIKEFCDSSTQSN